jgi:phage shock protein C
VSSTIFGSRNPFYGMKRFPDNGVIAGVCEGLAVHFDWNPRIVRVIAVLLVIFTGFWPTVVAYLFAWYILEPVKGAPPVEGTTVPPGNPGATPGPMAGGSATGSARPKPELKARFAKLDERLRKIEECVTDHAYQLRRELKKLES